jgi:hypothetical protein
LMYLLDRDVQELDGCDSRWHVVKVNRKVHADGPRVVKGECK